MQAAPARKSEAGIRAALILASIGFALFLAEVPAALHFLDYRALIGGGADWWPKNYVADRELIHIRRPGSHLEGTAKGGLVRLYYVPTAGLTTYHWNVTYDGSGFRNSRDLTSADIEVIGDSFVEGMTVSDDQLLTSRLKALSGKTVANLGQPGYGPQQELIVLKRYGLRLRPRQVVWMFYEGNDLDDVQHYDQFIHSKPSYWQDLIARSFTKNALQFIYQFFLPSGAQISGVASDHGNKAVEYFTNVDSYSTHHLTSADLGALDKTARIVQTATNLAANQGAKVLFVYVPDKFRVLRGVLQFPAESKCRTWELNDLPNRVHDTVLKAAPEIDYLDLTPLLQDAAKNGTVSYYPDDPHWNPEGHRIAAAAIARTLH